MKRSKYETICTETGKKKYRTLERANEMMLRTQERRGSRGAKRVYYCEECYGFHLTSWEGPRYEDRPVREKDVKLILLTEWQHLIKQQQDETGLDGETTQIDIGDEKGFAARTTGKPDPTFQHRIRN